MDKSVYRKGYFRRTRRGKVVKIVQEKYIRNDLEYGFINGKSASREVLVYIVTQAPHKQLLLIDTNIALHQIDVLEYNCPATATIVVVQTVLQELKHLNLSVYRRVLALIKDQSRNFIFYPNEISSETAVLREEGESINDANDRAIVSAAKYFQDAIRDVGKVAFISNDNANVKRAVSEGIESMTMRRYVDKFVTNYPELLDLVAADEAPADVRLDSNSVMYPVHLSMSEILSGIKTRRYLRGTIRCSRDNPLDCYVVIHSTDGKFRKSVQIKGLRRVNRAVDGDVVAIELIDKEIEEVGNFTNFETFHIRSKARASDDGVAIVGEETAALSTDALEGIAIKKGGDPVTGEMLRTEEVLYGRVVGIIRRKWRQYAGSLDISTASLLTSSTTSKITGTDSDSNSGEASAATVEFIPVDKRIPRIYISTRRLDELDSARLLVSIDHWPSNSLYPVGHYVRVLGTDGDKTVETQVLLHEFEVPHEDFSTDVMACLPPADWKITEDIIAQRTDLRHLPVVSIDPPGCKDIDDALHCLRLPNGRLEAGVHIADVTHFVHPDSAIDKEAAHRSTSTYLVERRLDMLPGLLTTQLCSLRSNEDHLAFSVIWEMDDDANIYDVRFCKSVIHSVASLTYDEGQAMLDDPVKSDPINQSVNLLNKLARILRKRRIDAGALTLASPEVRFKLDSETQNPTDVAMYMLKEANALVEEWMLLANITVSKQMLRYYPTLAILRRHQPPSREQFAPLLSAARAVGINLDISNSKTLADSLDAAVRPDDPYFNKLLRILSTRCMMPATYFCSGEIPPDQWHHYGLAAPVYTHFTSPIRRYADVLVHRLLAASIGVIPLPASNADRTKQQEQASHMNRRHRMAQYAQRASVGLHTLLFFSVNPSVETAYVLSLNPERFSVLVPRFGIESSLSWERIGTALSGGDFVLDFNPDSHSMVVYRTDQSSKESTSGAIDSRPEKRQRYRNSCSSSEAEERHIVGETLLSIQVFDKVRVSIKVRGGGADGERRLVVGLINNDIDLEEHLYRLNHPTDNTLGGEPMDASSG